MNRNSNRKPRALSQFPHFRPNSTSGFGRTVFQNRIFAGFRRFSLPVGPRNQAKRWKSKSKKKLKLKIPPLTELWSTFLHKFNLRNFFELLGSPPPPFVLWSTFRQMLQIVCSSIFRPNIASRALSELSDPVQYRAIFDCDAKLGLLYQSATLGSRDHDSDHAKCNAVLEPTVLVRFHSRTLRDSNIRERKILKGSKYAVSEDLTTLNVQTINRMDKNDLVQKTWSWNGKLFALLINGSKLLVRPFQTLQECVLLRTCIVSINVRWVVV